MLPRTKRSYYYGVRPVVRVRTREAAVQSPHHRAACIFRLAGQLPQLCAQTIFAYNPRTLLWAPLRRRRPADPHVVTRVPVRDAQLSRLMGDDH